MRTLDEHIELAESAVKSCRSIVERQRAWVAREEANSSDRDLLDTLEWTLLTLQEELDVLLAKRV